MIIVYTCHSVGYSLQWVLIRSWGVQEKWMVSVNWGNLMCVTFNSEFTHMHARTHACTHACMHARAHVHTHTHTHTHTHSQFLTTIYGCGTATADKWYKKGIRTLSDIKQSSEINLTNTQKLGIEHHHHLAVPVSRDKTEYICGYIFSQAEICCPGTTVEAVGGYRRYILYSGNFRRV